MVISDNPDVAPQIIRATSRAERNKNCSSEAQRVSRKLKTEISSTEERPPLDDREKVPWSTNLQPKLL